MIERTDLTNRMDAPKPKGSEEADAAIAAMKGQGAKPAAEPKNAAEAQAAVKVAEGEVQRLLGELRERITRARSVAPPSGDNQFAQGCFIRGRDAALGIIDGEPGG